MTITRRTARKHSASAGFSLIEMSIVVAVLGLLAVTLVTSGLIGREKYRLTETEEKLAKIQAAIQLYYNRTGFLPCAASGSELPDTVNFGVAANCSVAAVSGTQDIGAAGNEQLLMGVVPTRTLLLSDSFMNDEWGNRFSYVVVKKLATDATSFNNYSTTNANGVIEIQDGAGTYLSGGSTSNVMGYALISHGKDRKGAYSKQGSVGMACGAAKDSDNCDNDATFVKDEINDDDAASGAFYYDLLRHVSTKELKDGAGTTSGSSTSSTSGADPTPPAPASPMGSGEGGGSGSGSSSGGPGGSPNAGVATRSCFLHRPISVQQVFGCSVGTDKRLYCMGGQAVGQLGDGLVTTTSTTPKEVSGGYTDWAIVDTSQAAACALRESGEAYCWGGNSTGKLGNGTTTNASVPTLVSGGFTDWVYIDGGVDHSCGMRSNGKAYCWGDNTHGDWSYISAGNNASCGLRGGKVFCWGDNTAGQLGDGTNTASNIPVEVSGGFTDWSRVWSNQNYNCGIRAGRGYCWGQNANGQLGIGSVGGTVNVPTEISGAHTNWSIITGDDRATCGIRAGVAYCWGIRDYGRVGDGGATTGNQSSPALVTGGYTDYVHIATSPEHSCGARGNGSIFCWGRNESGEFGIGNTTDSATPIAAVTGISPKTCGFGADCSYDFVEAAKASYFSYALMPDGKAFAWGANWQGVFGNGTTTDSTTPVPMGTFTDWYAISADNPSDSACGIRKNGRLYCWGNRTWYNIPDGGSVVGNQLTPVEAALGYNDWVEIETEAEFSCARRGFGQLYCWGNGSFGRLGNGTTTNFNIPTQVSGNYSDWSDFDVGQEHTCGIRNDGEAYCWGEGSLGELGSGAFADSTTPVLVGGGITDWKRVNTEGFVTCGITESGRGYCWGNNFTGQLGNGTNFTQVNLPSEISGAHTDWSHISEGDESLCGIRAGNLYCWGDRSLGGVPDGGAMTGFQLTPALASGGITNWAFVKADGCGTTTTGKVYCWGLNDAGQVGDGTTTNRNVPTEVTTGLVNTCAGTCTNVQITANGRLISVDSAACAINKDGKLYCWGNNAGGSVGDGTTINRTTPVQVSGSYTDWLQVSNDNNISCGIRGTSGQGALYCWGEDSEQGLGNGAGVTSSSVPLLAAGGFTDWTRVSVSSTPHWGCGLRAGGRAFCWGTNTYGMLGMGDTTTRHTPTEITGAFTDWLHVGSHGHQACGIRGAGTSGTLYCWGRNNFGGVGDGSTTQRTSPTLVSGGFTDWTQVNGDYYHNCGVRANGRAYCWGYNANGQVGDNTTTQRTVPTEISGAHTDWTLVVGGTEQSCGIRGASNALWCWGYNGYGALGDGTSIDKLTPVQVTGTTNTNWGLVASGGNTVCAMKTSGETYCWGQNNVGQVGDGSFVVRNQPKQILTLIAPDPTNYCTTANCKIQIVGMSGMALALNHDGKSYAWGLNSTAGFGDGTTNSSSVPTTVGTSATVNSNWSYVSGDTAQYRSCGISSGKLYCWGNRERWLGDGGATTGLQLTPLEIGGGLTDWTQVEVGATAACAIRAGRLFCWGDGFGGRLGNGSTTDFNVPTEVAGAATDWIYTGGIDSFSCGIRGTGGQGTAYCWGSPANGSLGNGVTAGTFNTPQLISGGFTDWKMLNMETAHACGLRAAGRAYCWGINGDGRLGDGTTTQRTVPTEVSGANTDWTFIYAGHTNSYGIRGGRLYGWGTRAFGAMGDGTFGSGNQLTPVEVSGNFTDWKTVNSTDGNTCAARTTGEYYCWGINDAGQAGDGSTSMVLAPKLVAQVNGCAAGEVCPLQYPVVGDDALCTIASSGRLFCWGGGANGALGNGGISNKSRPVEVHGGYSDWTAIDGNFMLMCGIRDKGKVYCWGQNSNGQIGDGTTTARLVPTAVSSNLKFTHINADDGNGNACAITTDKKLYCWGDNAFGQVGDGTLIDRTVPTQTSGNYTDWIWITIQGANSACGIRGTNGQGTTWCWGDGGAGKLGDGNSPTSSPVPVQVAGVFTDWTQVNSDGGGAICGLRANGRAYCWGLNTNGRLGDGTTTTRTVPTEVAGGFTDWTAIYGNQLSCGVRAGGRAFCWGLNNNGGIGDGTIVDKSIPTEVLGGFTDWYSVYAGYRGACGARRNGSIWCWGPGALGQMGNGTTTATNKPTSAVANVEPASSEHCPDCRDFDASAYGCTIAGNGELYCWGSNGWGQVGNNTTIDQTVPQRIQAASGGWTDVARDNSHTCGISGGKLYCWGHRGLGRIGDGGAIAGSQTTPKEVSGGYTNWQNVSVNSEHACGRTTAGKLFCWGGNTNGQLGDGTTADKNVPTEVQGTFSDWSDHTSFGTHTCGIRSGGVMYCWGYNNRGQIGDGTTGVDRPSPTLVLGAFTDWYKLGRGGHETTCGIRTTGNAYCWGNNVYGQMGDGTTTDANTPVEIAGAYTNWEAISTPYHASYGIRGGKLYAWGRRVNYEVPDGQPVGSGAQTIPVQIGTESDWVSVSQNFYGATRANGKYYTWGTNSAGELGDGTTTDQNTPTEIIFASPRLKCAPGTLCAPDQLLGVDNAACGINDEGRLFCWGANGTGAVGDGTITNRTTPTEAAGNFTDWVWVDSTTGYSCGVRADGTGYCWGTNADGQLGDGSTSPRLSPTIVTGGYSWRMINNEDGSSAPVTCGVLTNGNARCWGRNDDGQIGDNTTVSKLTPTMVSGAHTNWLYVDPGSKFSCGIRGDGTSNSVWCWGDNSNGQLGNGSTTDSLIPVAVAGAGGAMNSAAFNDWVQINVGVWQSVCGLRSSGRAYCWGYNGTGALGDGTTTDRNVPTEVMGAHTDWTMISADNHSCGIRGGKLYCWGNDEFGKLGMGTVDAHRTTPGLVSGGYTDWTTVSPGWRGTCATREGGSVWCWGRNNEGALGNNTTTNSSIPVKVSNFTSRPETCPSCDVPVRAQVLSSDKTSCIVSKFGRAYCWGNNSTGQIGDGSSTDRLTPTEVSGGHRNWIQISNDDAISCGIRGANGEGDLYCWGSRVSGGLGDGGATAGNQTTPVQESYKYDDWRQVKVESASRHVCATRATGKAYCWGNNTYGELGNNTTTDSNFPFRVTGDHYDWIYAGAHGFISCGIRSSNGTYGTAYCWGRNHTGAIGDGTFTQRLIPTLVSGGFTDWTVISGNADFTCGLRRTGQAYCWGKNDFGQLGQGNTTDYTTPREVTGAFTDWSYIAAGSWHTCGIRGTENKLWCWGSNWEGSVGDNTAVDRNTPVEVAGIANANWSRVAAGNSSSCAMKSTGEVYCWGFNDEGQVGDGTFGAGNQRNQPKLVANITASNPAKACSEEGSGCTEIVPFSVGADNITCSVNGDGQLYCWGTNNVGEMGNGTSANQYNSPTLVSGGFTDWTQVSTEIDTTCGVRATGAAYCWGANGYGQIGDGTTTTSTTPKQVSLFNDFTRIDNDEFSSCGIRSNGTMYCWGRNNQGALGDGTLVDKSVPTLVSGGFTDWTDVTVSWGACGIRSGGRLYCWGSNGDGQAGVGVTGGTYTTPQEVSGAHTDWVMVNSTDRTTCGIRSNTRAYCWGRNADGEVGDNSTTTRNVPTEVAGASTGWTSISSSYQNSCGINSGRAYCWGSNTYGTIGNNTTTSSLIPVAAAGGITDFIAIRNTDGHTCAIRSNKQLYCWGLGFNGALGNGSTTNRHTPTLVDIYHRPKTKCGSCTPVQPYVTAGYVIDADGRAWGYGNNASGRLGNGTTSNSTVPVQPSSIASTGWSMIELDGDMTTADNRVCGITGGRLYCWGARTRYLGDGGATTGNQLTPVEVSGGYNDWQQVKVQNTRVCGTRGNGTAWCFGDQPQGQFGISSTTTFNVPTASMTSFSDWVKVSANEETVCGLRMNGTIYCAGADFRGGLGNGAPATNSSTPVLVAGGFSDWTFLADAETFNQCAIRTNGRAYCWGGCVEAQCGDGTSGVGNFKFVPTEIAGAHTDWQSINAGHFGGCGIRGSHGIGRAYCWGDRSVATMGDGGGTVGLVTSPTEVAGGYTNWTYIDQGGYRGCGARANGKYYCWTSGWPHNGNANGNLGTGDTTNYDKPHEVIAGIRAPIPNEPGCISSACHIAQVEPGFRITCWIASDTRIYCAGGNTNSVYGNGNTTTSQVPLAAYGGTTGWLKIANDVTSAEGFTCALNRNGTIQCAGANGNGQLGNGLSPTASTTPVTISGGFTDWVDVDADFTHACGLRGSGQLYCWGANDTGQLGDNSLISKSTPSQVNGSFTDWQSVSTGSNHTCGLRGSGVAWCWGTGANGRLGNGTANSSIPLLVNGGFTDWKQIDAGNIHTCGLRANNRAYCWGAGGGGRIGDGFAVQRNNPTEIAGAFTDWTDIAAGFMNSCGIRAGFIYCWGDRTETVVQADGGALTGNQTTPSLILGGGGWMDVEIENQNACAIHTDGSFSCWGMNDIGQAGIGAVGQLTTPTKVKNIVGCNP